MEAKGFVGGLLDFSFTSFITPKIVKFLYIIGIIFGLLMIIVSLFTLGWWGLLVGPISFILGLLGLRIYLELICIFFRIEGHLTKMSGETKPEAPH
jgi:hypothetical protein